jgi:hypothetical protein
MTMAETADPRPTPPEQPDETECCRSGCDPCIFDLYQQEVEEYREKLKAWEARQGEGSRPAP